MYVKTVAELDSVHPHESFAGHVKAVWDVTVLPCAGLSRALRGVWHAWSPPHLFRVVPPQCLGELKMLSQMPWMFPSHHNLKGIQQEQWKHIWGVNLIVLKIEFFQNWELPVFILGFFGHPFFFKLNHLKTKMTLHLWIQVIFINTKASVLC